MRDFSNRTAVVTGAASGIGYAFAERFAAEMGMHVAMDPSNVAVQVWDATVNDRIYILPHPGFDEIVKDRVDRILSRSAPAQLDHADLARRREAGELV